MTDRITKERVKELREWLHSVSEEIFNQPANSPQHGIVADLLALLSEAKPAPPTGGERERLLKLWDDCYACTSTHLYGAPKYGPDYHAIRSLLLSAPKTVTREWLYDFVRFIYGHYEAGIAIPIADKLRELGITVEDKSEGEDE